MPRKPTGQVLERTGANGRTYALRFRAYGHRHYLTLGRRGEGWDRKRAERELRHVLADVERGIWQPPTPDPEPVPEQRDPTFHEFASEWFDRHRPEWRDGTAEDYQWALTYHLLPWFKDRRLSCITAEDVDSYKASKLREGTLAPATLNKTLVRLAQILDEAQEYGYLDRNPARGRRRRVKASPPKRPHVEPEQLMALLDAADPWHRPVIATLAGAGLRPGEACALNWRDVNLASATLTVGRSKTDAGVRRVDLTPALREELTEWKARSRRTKPTDPVFVCRPYNGKIGRQTKDNIGRRLKATIKRANEQLAKLDIEAIREDVSPHSLRRTYATVRAALRDDPVYIADQIGHRDPRTTLTIYAKAAKRRERLSGAYLKAFDRALDWARMGTNADIVSPSQAPAFDAATMERAADRDKLDTPGA